MAYIHNLFSEAWCVFIYIYIHAGSGTKALILLAHKVGLTWIVLVWAGLGWCGVGLGWGWVGWGGVGRGGWFGRGVNLST